MPAVFLDRLPLPSLQAYTVISVLLLSGSVYYAVQVTSQLEWKINAAVNLDLSTDIDTTMTVGNLTFVSGHQLTLEQFLLEHHHYIRRLLEVMYFMFQEPLCVWIRDRGKGIPGKVDDGKASADPGGVAMFHGDPEAERLGSDRVLHLGSGLIPARSKTISGIRH
ncbi:hypothetical protein HPB47_006546 [Ixodes persulcatus]|uniref:Uncharacterized protein n=1 Tax=Ixodes persulcatus TaxID=34615 RepID=A0AC60PAA3_IXOPE|nr:hypothetical protein HPB47_006546 [Ixodes persulcatus]